MFLLIAGIVVLAGDRRRVLGAAAARRQAASLRRYRIGALYRRRHLRRRSRWAFPMMLSGVFNLLGAVVMTSAHRAGSAAVADERARRPDRDRGRAGDRARRDLGRGIHARLPRPHRRGRRRDPAPSPISIREHALGAGARARRAARRRPADRPAARHSGRDQGHHRYRRLSDRIRLAASAPGRRPWHDATVVAKLRAAGAVIIGKTVTTEFAYFHPGPTRNPHDPARTPGGSSSGSAAAVAAGMVPLALGTQTNGSIDPAGGVLRRVRRQAEPRARVARRRPAAVAHARPCRRRSRARWRISRCCST